MNGRVWAASQSVALARSGGKDSSLALAALRADPSVEVVALLTTVTRDYDRISIHGVRRAILEAQVAQLELPLLEAVIPAGATNEIYEEAFAGALEVDVRAYREKLLASLG